MQPKEHHGNDWGVERLQHAGWLNISRVLLPEKSWLRVNMPGLMLTMACDIQTPGKQSCSTGNGFHEREMCLGFLSCQNFFWIWTLLLQKFELFGSALYGEQRWGQWKISERSFKESASSCWRQTLPWKPTCTVVGHTHFSGNTLLTHSSAEFSYKFFLASEQAPGLIYKDLEQIVLNCQISHSLSSEGQHLEMASHCARCCTAIEKKGSLALLNSKFSLLWVLRRPRC